MANTIGIVGICIAGVALLFAIIALAADKWELGDVVIGGYTYENVKIGLWKVCTVELYVGETCYDIEFIPLLLPVTDEQERSVSACKAMIFFAIFATTGAIGCALCVMFVMKDKRTLFLAAGVLNTASGFLLLIAMLVYAEKVKSKGSHFHYGFFLDIIAMVAAWVAGVLMISAKSSAMD